jgi:hypothetical protein
VRPAPAAEDHLPVQGSPSGIAKLILPEFPVTPSAFTCKTGSGFVWLSGPTTGTIVAVTLHAITHTVDAEIKAALAQAMNLLLMYVDYSP